MEDSKKDLENTELQPLCDEELDAVAGGARTPAPTCPCCTGGPVPQALPTLTAGSAPRLYAPRRSKQVEPCGGQLEGAPNYDKVVQASRCMSPRLPARASETTRRPRRPTMEDTAKKEIEDTELYPLCDEELEQVAGAKTTPGGTCPCCPTGVTRK